MTTNESGEQPNELQQEDSLKRVAEIAREALKEISENRLNRDKYALMDRARAAYRQIAGETTDD